MDNIERIFQPNMNGGLKKTMMPERKQEPEKNRTVMVAIVVLVIFILGSLGASFYFYQKYKKAVSNPAAVSLEEAREITEKIGKFIELPEESPTLATVSNKEKLQNQPFFSKAENGDKVLIYSQVGKAILYRPSTNKIIEVTSLTGGGNTSSVQENINQNLQE